MTDGSGSGVRGSADGSVGGSVHRWRRKCAALFGNLLAVAGAVAHDELRKIVDSDGSGRVVAAAGDSLADRVQLPTRSL